MPDQPGTGPNPVHAEVRYEKSDAAIGPIMGFGAGLLLAGLVIQTVLVFVFDDFKESARKEDAPLPGLAAKERLRLPRDLAKIPRPALQESETQDMEQMRRAEDAVLASYGWVDSKAGIVCIPITEAMAILANPETAKAHGIRVEIAKKKGGPR